MMLRRSKNFLNCKIYADGHIKNDCPFQELVTNFNGHYKKLTPNEKNDIKTYLQNEITAHRDIGHTYFAGPLEGAFWGFVATVSSALVATTLEKLTGHDDSYLSIENFGVVAVGTLFTMACARLEQQQESMRYRRSHLLQLAQLCDQPELNYQPNVSRRG